MRLRMLILMTAIALLILPLAVTACTKQSTSGSDQTTITQTSTRTETIATSTEFSIGQINYDGYPKVDGSTATIPLAMALVRYVTGCDEAEAEQTIDFSKTNNSYYALNENQADLLLVYAPAQSTIDELDVFNSMDIREIGLDALVFIVNEDNPIDSLTADQVRGIYSGQITHWSEVGGNDREIVPFQRPELSGSQTLMLKLMMKDTAMMAPRMETISESMADIIQDIASYNNSANAMGYSVYYYAKNMFEQPGLKFLAIDGVLPSNETINSQAYSYVNPFYGVVRKPSDNPAASTLLDWLLTPDGQSLLESAGYVPILPMS